MRRNIQNRCTEAIAIFLGLAHKRREHTHSPLQSQAVRLQVARVLKVEINWYRAWELTPEGCLGVRQSCLCRKHAWGAKLLLCFDGFYGLACIVWNSVVDLHGREQHGQIYKHGAYGSAGKPGAEFVTLYHAPSHQRSCVTRTRRAAPAGSAGVAHAGGRVQVCRLIPPSPAPEIAAPTCRQSDG